MSKPTVINMETNQLDEDLDELALLCAYWAKARTQGRTPRLIKSAILILITELAKEDL